jgi:two-component system cell cycle response regulator
VKILIADDDSVSRRMLSAMLSSWNYEVIMAENGSQAWALLNSINAPRLAILDWIMPGYNGLDIVKKLREQPGNAYTYVILLTVKSDHDDLITAMDCGADDYMTKPFDPQELRVRLCSGQRILDLQEQLIAAQEALREQVRYDSLTGALNRDALMEALRLELAREERIGFPVAVVMGDLDHFKSVNDEYGHLVGDETLKRASQFMRTHIRPYDSLGRYGGDEFIMVLPGCRQAEAMIVAERVRQCFSGQTMMIQDRALKVTVSLGVTASDMVADKTPEALIQAADAALYQAKKSGRNRIATT